MLSGKYAGSGATKLRTIKAAGGRRGWRKLKAEALRLLGEGGRQVLRSAKAGEVFYPRIDGPKNIAEADELIASQGHYENARGVTIEVSLRTGDPRIDKKTVGSHYAPIGSVFARDLAVQAREARIRGEPLNYKRTAPTVTGRTLSSGGPPGSGASGAGEGSTGFTRGMSRIYGTERSGLHHRTSSRIEELTSRRDRAPLAGRPSMPDPREGGVELHEPL